MSKWSMQKNGIHPKTNNLNFGHVYKHNKNSMSKNSNCLLPSTLKNINIARSIDYHKMLSYLTCELCSFCNFVNFKVIWFWQLKNGNWFMSIWIMLSCMIKCKFYMLSCLIRCKFYILQFTLLFLGVLEILLCCIYLHWLMTHICMVCKNMIQRYQ